MEKRIFDPFAYRDIWLKPLSTDDLPYTLAWRNAYCQWFNDTKPIDAISHQNWFAHYQKKNNDFVFIIEDHAGNKIGQDAIYNIDWENKTGEFGRFVVNPDFAGKGYMKLGCEALIALVQQELVLTSIYLEVKKDNEAAIHIYEACQFKVTGLLDNGNVKMQRAL